MDKSFLAFVLVGLGFIYFVTNFIGEIQKDDVVYQNNDYVEKHKYDKYENVDSVGQDTLNLLGASEKTQKEAWNASSLKEEFITLFPDFGDMEKFIKNRIIGKYLQGVLLQKLDEVQGKFFTGEITHEQAKKILTSTL